MLYQKKIKRTSTIYYYPYYLFVINYCFYYYCFIVIVIVVIIYYSNFITYLSTYPYLSTLFFVFLLWRVEVMKRR